MWRSDIGGDDYGVARIGANEQDVDVIRGRQFLEETNAGFSSVHSEPNFRWMFQCIAVMNDQRAIPAARLNAVCPVVGGSARAARTKPSRL
jgi:hypothetical protein